jgi:hypothetical protein
MRWFRLREPRHFVAAQDLDLATHCHSYNSQRKSCCRLVSKVLEFAHLEHRFSRLRAVLHRP